MIEEQDKNEPGSFTPIAKPGKNQVICPKCGAINSTRNTTCENCHFDLYAALGTLSPDERKAYLYQEMLSPKKKLLEFGIGFLGWYLLFGLIGLGVSNSLNPYGCVISPIILVVILAFKFRWVAFGILSAIASNFAISMILGLQFNAICFYPFFYK
jgi:ribosomal protein L40E